tara:strand:- start:29156 stop:29440 length:285 start_codon:yes stop_codon:yes gene_type:complete
MKIQPKCIIVKEDAKEIMGIAYTSNGYILPCCWLDSKTLEKELMSKGLLNESLKLSNNNSIEDIITSNSWKNFIEELFLNPENTISKCKIKCGQ